MGLSVVVRVCCFQSDAFQDDLFPPCASGHASHTSDEWVGGSDKAPMTMDMRPRSVGGPNDPAAAAGLAKKKKQFTPLKSLKDLQKEVSIVASRKFCFLLRLAGSIFHKMGNFWAADVRKGSVVLTISFISIKWPRPSW